MRFIRNSKVFEVSVIDRFDNGSIKRVHIQRHASVGVSPILSIVWKDNLVLCKKLPDGQHIDLTRRHDCTKLDLCLGAAIDYHDDDFNVDGEYLVALHLHDSDLDIMSPIRLCTSESDEDLIATCLSCAHGCTNSLGESILAFFDDGRFSHYYCSYCGDTCESDLAIQSDGSVLEAGDVASENPGDGAANLAKITFIARTTFKDPETGGEVELQIMKDHRSGAIVGIDSSFLENTDQPVSSPYELGIVYDEEGM